MQRSEFASHYERLLLGCELPEDITLNNVHSVSQPVFISYDKEFWY